MEDKGGRAKLIFIGGEKPIVEKTGARYGLPPADDIYFLDAVVHANGEVETPPDWEAFAADCPPLLKNAEAAAVVAYQGIHNPALEQEAKILIDKTCGKNAVCGYELFWDLNYIKRGAGTLLNARLLPVIEKFLGAMRLSLEKRGVQAPMVIVRSDGSLMSEAFSREKPVETILCGPASSVMGGLHLAGRKDCIVVDMGGTTTDIAIVRDGVPVKTDGVTIGKWSTFVKSVYIHTFGLGGDSRIRLDRDNGLAIGPERVLPLCVAASCFPGVKEELQELIASRRKTPQPLQEFLYLLRDVSDDPYYTDRERDICRTLKQHSILRLDRLAAAVDCDLYKLDTERLEKESIVMRCGLTPTDIMHLRGDFDRFDTGASALGAAFVATRLSLTPDELCERVFEQVKRMMYVHIVHMLLENEDPAYKTMGGAGLDRLIGQSWDNRGKKSYLSFGFHTPAALVGIGAPIHLFLPDVAAALGADCIIPDSAPVANALGAVVGQISASVTVNVQPSREDSGEEYYLVFAPDRRIRAAEYEEAVSLACEAAENDAREEAQRRGAAGELTVTCDVQPVTARVGHTVDSTQEVLLRVEVTARATGGAGF